MPEGHDRSLTIPYPVTSARYFTGQLYLLQYWEALSASGGVGEAVTHLAHEGRDDAVEGYTLIMKEAPRRLSNPHLSSAQSPEVFCRLQFQEADVSRLLLACCFLDTKRAGSSPIPGMCGQYLAAWSEDTLPGNVRSVSG